ncbi:MAG: hypothetical protein HY579_06930 [Nitrospinae bacterium]|nr:hypothetical protein [Nitrospinota bacterium]
MSAKTIKLEIPFQKLISIVDQLDPDEKLILKKKLEKHEAATWQERFGKALRQLGRKNVRFSEKEVAGDVKKAIAEARAGAKN